MRNSGFIALLLAVLFAFSACDGSKKIHLGANQDVDFAGDDANSGTGEDSDFVDDSGNTGNTGNTGDTGDTGDTGNTGNTGDTVSDSITGDDDIIIPPDCTEDDECAVLDGQCVKGVCSSEGKCVVENLPETTACDDGIFCNGEDKCNNSGKCITGATYPCGDYFCSEGNGACCEGGFAGADCSKCVRFVKVASAGTPDGLSWNTAFNTVHEAVNSANDAVLTGGNASCEVWIAQGTYAVSTTIAMAPNVPVIGGFTGIGEERDNDPQLTVLDGSGAGDNIIDATNAVNALLRSVKLYGNVNDGAADNFAGGMYVQGVTGFAINSVVFESNRAVGQSADNGYEGKGGALAIIESEVSVSDCEFISNSAENGSRPGTGSSTAGSFGGAIYISAGTVTISNSTFTTNTVIQQENGSASGGAIFAYMPVSLTISGCTFTGNTSENWGGAMRVEGGNVIFTGNTFSGNSAGNNGGGVEFNAVTSASFSGNTFTRNVASTGGGVHVSNKSNATFDKDFFTENEATTVGAGLSVVNSTVQVSSLKFQSNNCKGGTECRGGAIALDVNAIGTFVNTLITKNNAKNYGGGLYTRDHSTANLVFSTLADNTTTSGCSSTGSGIHNYDSGTTNIIDSIIHGNTPCNQTQNNTNSATNVSYTLFQGGYSGTGNINADPAFVDRANNDYHLNTGSPCIDTALNDAANPVIDLDAKTRPNGSGYDMGCYEF